MNQEIPEVQAGFQKGRKTSDQIANIPWIMEKTREFQEKKIIIYFCFDDYAKTLTVDNNKWWTPLTKIGVSDHLSCFLRNLHKGQESTTKTGYGTADSFKIGKEVKQKLHIVTLLI